MDVNSIYEFISENMYGNDKFNVYQYADDEDLRAIHLDDLVRDLRDNSIAGDPEARLYWSEVSALMFVYLLQVPADEQSAENFFGIIENDIYAGVLDHVYEEEIDEPTSLYGLLRDAIEGDDEVSREELLAMCVSPFGIEFLTDVLYGGVLEGETGSYKVGTKEIDVNEMTVDQYTSILKERIGGNLNACLYWTELVTLFNVFIYNNKDVDNIEFFKLLDDIYGIEFVEEDEPVVVEAIESDDGAEVVEAEVVEE